jgi:hypothetical protein
VGDLTIAFRTDEPDLTLPHRGTAEPMPLGLVRDHQLGPDPRPALSRVWRHGSRPTGQGRRRWRALDLGTVRAVVEADAPRVSCAEHGVVVAAVPWARHGAGHTRAFDDTVAWLATTCSKTAVRQLMRIAWPDCAGSGSTRSATRKATSTSPSWSTTTPVGWSGPPPATTSGR